MNDYAIVGRIDSANRSKSGKSTSVKINGQYFLSKDFALENLVGATISGTCSDSEYNGKVMHWLNAYTVDSGAGGIPPAVSRGTPQTASQAPQDTLSGRDFLPMTSNIVAHLIAHGGKPEDVAPWVMAAKATLRGRPVIEKAAPKPELSEGLPDPEFNQDIPY